MFRIDLAVLCLSVVQYSIPQSYSVDFAFPSDKSDELACTFANGSVGRCVKDCLNASYEHQLGINPTICHFENNAPIVCCLTKTRLPLINLFPNIAATTTYDPNSGAQNDRRKSAVNCDNYAENLFDLVSGDFFSIVRGLPTLDAEFPHMVRCV